MSVNGETVTAQGTNVNPATDVIAVDGETISLDTPRHYIALNKPLGYVSTVSDPYADKKVVDLVRVDGARIVPVGRLDADSEGLLLMSDDGDFVFKVTHPSQSMGKTYMVTVKGKPTEDALKRIAKGLKLADGYTTAPAGAKYVGKGTEPGSSLVELVLHEGKYRQVRRMLDAIGHPVLRLVRTRVGPVLIGTLQPGEWRNLTAHELRLIAEGKNAPDPEPVVEERFGQRGHYDGERRPPERERVYVQRRPMSGNAPGGARPGGRPPQRPSFGGDRPRPQGLNRPGDDRPQFGGDRPRPSFGDRPQGDRPRPSFGDRPQGDRPRPAFGSDRPQGDRPRPSFGGDRPRPAFGGDRPRPSFGGDRPQYGGNRPSGGDRPRFGGDRPQGGRPRPQGDRPAFGGDRRPQGGGERRFDSRPTGQGGGDRPRPSFGNDRPQNRPQDGAPRPRFDAPRPQGGGDRPQFGNDRPRPSFGGDRPRPQFGGDRPRPSFGGGGGDRPNNSYRGGGGDAPRRPFNSGGGQGGGTRPPYRPAQRPRDSNTRS